jgi:hypothetical protein
VARDDAPPLDVLPAWAVPAEPQRLGWLIESLWTAQGVGWIAASPKSTKTWLALDLAVSVASGTDAIGRYPVATPGPVLFYGAEDSVAHLRQRIEGIALARGVSLADLDLGLIVAPSLRLDTDRDLTRLRRTLEQRRPRLLILDPLVRMHRLDENSAGEVSALLGALRELQRAYGAALILVHHLRKKGAPRGQDGQSLRGSGDIHAWSDSSLYLRRRDKQVIMTVEHRSAPAPEPCTLELATDPAPHLRVVEGGTAADAGAAADVAEGIVRILAQAIQPMTREALREALRTRNATIGDALVRLRADGRVERSAAGFTLRRAE